MILRERLMKKHAGIIIISLILAAMASMQSAHGDPITFQQGMDGYTGGEDRAIAADGLPQPSETRLRIKYLGEEKYNTIIRFDNIESELNDATITSATITLTFRAEHVGWSPAMIDIYPCLKHWMMPDWDNATTTIAWDTPGAQGSGDRGILNNSVYMGYRSYPSPIYPNKGKYDFTLSTDLVQSWIDEPDSNHGVILAMNPSYPTDVTFFSNEDFDPCCHPALTITIETLVDVPYVIGEVYDTAVGMISDAGLIVGEVRYEYNEEDPCIVLDQDPCSGSLDMGESIALWVSRGPQPTPDYNGDYVVDTLDLILLADDWLKCEDVTTDLTDDGCIDMSDFAVFAAAWMEVTIVADISGDDGCVGIEDLAEMAQQWLTCEETNTADLFDGQDGGCVNMLDYAIMSQQWGLCDGP